MPHKAEKDLVILKEQYVHIEKDSFLNQRMYIQNNKIDNRKSQYFEIFNNDCIRYHSYLDTLNKTLGIDRFIIFKTSDSLLPDFSNVDKIKLQEHFFTKGNELCFKTGEQPKYGVIEGKPTVRILKLYQYIKIGMIFI